MGGLTRRPKLEGHAVVALAWPATHELTESLAWSGPGVSPLSRCPEPAGAGGVVG